MTFWSIVRTVATGILLFLGGSHLGVLGNTCQLITPVNFNAKTLDQAAAWKPYFDSRSRPFVSKDGVAFKGGEGLSWKVTLTPSRSISLELNWDKKLYPGGTLFYGLYDQSSLPELRSSMCSQNLQKMGNLPPGNLLDHGDPLDTTTLNFASSMSMFRTVYKTQPLRVDSKSPKRIYVLVGILDYTNPNSRVLGRFFASSPDRMPTSEQLCSSSSGGAAGGFFRWLVVGVSCT
jgi:hypothetical protein